jgi:glycosyltransferase involved in cell wall biosynthesis
MVARVRNEPRTGADPVGVLMLTKGLGRGGSERLLADTVAHLDPARYRVEVAYLLPWKDALADEVAASGAGVVCLDARRPASLAWLRRLRRLVRDRDIRLVHTHMPAPAAAARVVLPGRSPAFVHTEHNLWGRYRAPTRWANRLTWRRNAAAVAVSGAVAASVRARRPRPEVVVHGLDGASRPPAPRAAACAALGLAPAGPVVGTVGNLTAKKDHATLVEALARLVGEWPDARLVVVGAGPLEADLRARAARAGLADRVVLAGSRGDVAEVLGAFDVFVLSSRAEGLPIALLEAMAAERPCVATSVGGIPEVVTDGVDGLLVPPGDADALATAVSKLLADPDRRADLGARAAVRARDFDIAAAVRRLEAIYDRALAGTSGTAAPARAVPW